MKKYIRPEVFVCRELLEHNFCASFNSTDNTENWTIEEEETI